MSDYGEHPTQYGNLSDTELYSMYREEVFNNLSEDKKLDLLQETVNRDALERGELGSPLVVFASLPADISGDAANGVIQVNREMVVDRQQSFEYNGRTIIHSVDDANMQALNTILHENTHCWQDQIIDGTITCSDINLSNQYQANNFDSSAVLIDGSYRLGSQYLTGETAGGYYMYYFQSTERDAFKYAEIKTDSIIQGLADKYGTEKSFEAYAKGMEANGYKEMEQRAIQLFQNSNFEKDLNQTLMNQYFGTTVAVNPNTERAVKSEMIATYQSIQSQIVQSNNLSIQEAHSMGSNAGSEFQAMQEMQTGTELNGDVDNSLEGVSDDVGGLDDDGGFDGGEGCDSDLGV